MVESRVPRYVGVVESTVPRHLGMVESMLPRYVGVVESGIEKLCSNSSSHPVYSVLSFSQHRAFKGLLLCIWV